MVLRYNLPGSSTNPEIFDISPTSIYVYSPNFHEMKVLSERH